MISFKILADLEQGLSAIERRQPSFDFLPNRVTLATSIPSRLLDERQYRRGWARGHLFDIWNPLPSCKYANRSAAKPRQFATRSPILISQNIRGLWARRRTLDPIFAALCDRSNSLGHL